MPQVNRLSLVVRLPDLAYHDEVTPAHPGVYVAVPDLRLSVDVCWEVWVCARRR
jgi:hypothetical protein